MAYPATSDYNASPTGVKLFGASNDQVECASCHDPHGSGTNFLRVAQDANSALCVTCHVK